MLLSETEEREATYKMDLGQVFTNSIVAKYMASLFDLDKNDSILERIIQRLIQFNEPQTCCA